MVEPFTVESLGLHAFALAEYASVDEKSKATPGPALIAGRKKTGDNLADRRAKLKSELKAVEDMIARNDSDVAAYQKRFEDGDPTLAKVALKSAITKFRRKCRKDLSGNYRVVKDAPTVLRVFDVVVDLWNKKNRNPNGVPMFTADIANRVKNADGKPISTRQVQTYLTRLEAGRHLRIHDRTGGRSKALRLSPPEHPILCHYVATLDDFEVTTAAELADDYERGE